MRQLISRLPRYGLVWIYINWIAINVILLWDLRTGVVWVLRKVRCGDYLIISWVVVIVKKVICRIVIFPSCTMTNSDDISDTVAAGVSLYDAFRIFFMCWLVAEHWSFTTSKLGCCPIVFIATLWHTWTCALYILETGSAWGLFMAMVYFP